MSEELGNVQSNEAASEINRLESTPGFILPDEKGQLLRDVNKPEYDRLESLRDAAYKRAADFQNENQVETPEAPQSVIAKVNQATKELETAGFQGEGLADQFIESGRDVTSEVGLQQLCDDIRQEIEQVNELMEGSDIDIDEVLEAPTIAKFEGYRQMRFLGQGDYKSLTPLIVKDVTTLGMPAKQIQQVRDFLSTAEPGDPLSDDITNIIIRHIHQAKKEMSEK